MDRNELNVANVVKELVKNSIDAQSNVVRVEFNKDFDIRVTDNGCGFDEPTLQSIGVRQVFLPQSLQKSEHRYGKNGKFLYEMAKATAEIFIEKIKQNSGDRYYKTIVDSKSAYKVYRTDRNYKDAMVKTDQGSMIVLNTLKLSIGNADQIKASMLNSVVELALMNFDVDISVKDTATQQTLYESYRTKNLFEKFEQLLESHQFFSKLQSVSCEKHNVKVELFLCEDGTSTRAFQFAFFNRSSDRDGKWRKIVNRLCRKRFVNDLNRKYPAYLLNINAMNFQDNPLAFNIVIDKCIRKCVEQLSKLPLTSKRSASQSDAMEPIRGIATCNEVAPEENKEAVKGVSLGDYIFNNSCENYKQLNQDSGVYRKKICENWLITLDKPKPKDPNDDSLQSVAIDRIKSQKDDHLFKKPKPKRRSHKPVVIMPRTPKPLEHVPSQSFKPSTYIKAFNNSSLIRTSKRLLLETSAGRKPRHSRVESTPNPLKSIKPAKSEMRTRKSSHNSKPNERQDRLELLPIETEDQMDMIPSTSFANPIPAVTFNELSAHQNDINNEFRDAFRNPFDFASERETLETFDLKWQTTNFNLNFSSSIAIRKICEDDPFMDLQEPDIGENHSIRNSIGSNGTQQLTEKPAASTTSQFESNRPMASSAYSETEFRYQRHQNDSFQTHYSRRTYRNVSISKYSQCSRSNVSSKENKNGSQFKPNPSPSTSSAVTPVQRQNSPLDMLGDNVRQTGWPVTININFGLPLK